MDAFVLLQHLLPKQWLTETAGRFASMQGGAITHAAIRRFAARYGVDLSEAADPRVESYATFNDFFTRALHPGARPQAAATWTCPVDGAISQFGPIEAGQLFQAKGHHYSAQSLLGGTAAEAEPYAQGFFATLYLSPRDYHRIHMPIAGRLRRMVHVPGSLYSVNPTTARGIPGLFARNERVVCHFETARGPLLMVLVGATIVGSIATVWHGQVTPPRTGQVRQWTYDDPVVQLAQGEEMGRFLLGSTVILLWPKLDLRFASDWAAQRPVRLGEAMAD